MENVKVVVLIGSLRKDSLNRAIFNTAVEVCPKGLMLTELKIGDLPLFNQDNENDPPESVKQLKNKIEESDAVLFITPEHNYSVPGVLKNAIDWGSRPYGNNSWANKPTAIMSASVGIIGGARAQYHLRQMFVFMNMIPINMPEVMVPQAAEKVENGKIKDDHTIKKISEQLNALKDWVKKWN